MLKSLKNYFLNAPVRRKLMVMLVLVALSASLVLSLVFSLTNYNSEQKTLARELMLLGQIIAKRTAPTMEFVKTGSANAVLKNLEDLAEKPSVILACVYFDSGELLAKYTPDEVKGDCPEFSELPFNYGYDFKDSRLYTYQSIIAAGQLEKPLGSLYMVSDLREMREHMRDIALETLGLLFFVIIGVYIFARRIQGIISNPIMKLTEIVEKVKKEKNYNLRAEKSYNDEIGTLTEGFNGMMAEVEERDINLEDQVRQRTAELENAISIKSDFLSNMSHEIRTPVHQINVYARFMNEDWEEASEEERKGWRRRVFDASGRLENLIHSLLDMSKLGRGGATLSLSKESIRDMVNSTIEGMSYDLTKHHVAVEINDLAEGLEVECDRTRILQILTNLFANGVRYGNGSTLIATIKKDTIYCKRRGEVPALHFSLADKGIGIPEKELEDIFELNFQSSRTRTGAGGTGIGLSIIRDLIKLHGGKVWAENNPGGGSTFHFIIPLESDYGKANAE